MTTNTPTLIIADDNADFAQLLARKAEKEGWTVVLCRDGKELLVAVDRKTGSALILIDINTNVVGSSAVVRKLRRKRCVRSK